MKPRRLKFVRITETNQNFREEVALGQNRMQKAFQNALRKAGNQSPTFPFSFWEFLQHKNAKKEERRGKTWGKIGEGKNNGKREREKGTGKEEQRGEGINCSIKEIDNCKCKGTKTFD